MWKVIFKYAINIRDTNNLTMVKSNFTEKIKKLCIILEDKIMVS